MIHFQIPTYSLRYPHDVWESCLYFETSTYNLRHVNTVWDTYILLDVPTYCLRLLHSVSDTYIHPETFVYSWDTYIHSETSTYIFKCLHTLWDTYIYLVTWDTNISLFQGTVTILWLLVIFCWGRLWNVVYYIKQRLYNWLFVHNLWEMVSDISFNASLNNT
jgi:hypothetical protein